MICAKEGRGAVGLLKYMPGRLFGIMGRIPVSVLLKIEEIRLGAFKPIIVYMNNACFYVTGEGKLSGRSGEGMHINADELKETFRLLCDGSVYAMEENIKNGFVTTCGGHRVGICGSVTAKANKVEAIKDISYLNIRIAHEIIGAADGVLEYIINPDLKSTLIVSPPGGGKTTLLRDLCRRLGGDDTFSYKVALADERGEIAGSFMGKPVNDVGDRTCVMDGCPKSVAMEMLLRGMGADVVVTDEIGGEGDEKALSNLLRCGVRVIASAHGRTMEDLSRLPLIGKGGFENIIILENKRVKEVKRFGA